MGVAREILDVPRPRNTIVNDSKVDGPNRYAVRARQGSKYETGTNPRPINGPVIGHIVNGKYVPVVPKAGSDGAGMLSYGSSALVKSVSEDILSDLLKVYSISDSYSMIAAASLRVIKPHVSSGRMSSLYEQTFLSRYYPGASLSKNSMTDLYRRIGMDDDKMRAFYRLRLERVAASHHIIIDGTLKQDVSTVNDLSAFSYKSRVKGVKDISILYAYDLEMMEPLASGVFPGNSIDSVSYNEFVSSSGITKGIIVDDKGFPVSKIRGILKTYTELHYLTPLKRSDTRITKYAMLQFDGVVRNIRENVLCRKVKIGEGSFLYAFKDSWTEYKEKRSYLEHAAKKDSFSADAYYSKEESFGVIVLESDLDLTPEKAYLCYKDRWKLEVVFKRYKSDISLYTTNVQTDFSVIGSEFVNLLSTIMTCRIVKKATAAQLLEKMTYDDLLDDLSSAWRKTSSQETPKSTDAGWVHTIGKVKEELELLGLSTPAAPPITEKKKRGRPRKDDRQDNMQQPEELPEKKDADGGEDSITPTQAVGRRGRPRKDTEPDKGKHPVGKPTETTGITATEQSFPARKRGRPKKVETEK